MQLLQYANAPLKKEGGDAPKQPSAIGHAGASPSERKVDEKKQKENDAELKQAEALAEKDARDGRDQH